MCLKLLAPRLGSRRSSVRVAMFALGPLLASEASLPSGYKIGREKSKHLLGPPGLPGSGWLVTHSSLHPVTIPRGRQCPLHLTEEDTKCRTGKGASVKEGAEMSEGKIHDLKQNCAQKCPLWPYL